MVFEKDAGHSKFMEEVYECQSRLPGTNWNPASTPWTDVVSSTGFNYIILNLLHTKLIFVAILIPL